MLRREKSEEHDMQSNIKLWKYMNDMYTVKQTLSRHTSSTFSTWDSKAASASFPAAVVEATEMSSFSERPVGVLV